jgi:predicted MFS family arabinose efflux permease
VAAHGGYWAVLAERPVRRLLAASLAGRLAFSMLPLAFVLFTTARAGTAAAGALMAAFGATSVLAPARGRIVDRRGPTALIGFALACSGALVALTAAGAAGAPAGALVALGGLVGLAVPPLGPFTRALWSAALEGEPLKRVFALDSAGEEGTLIFAPLAVALLVAVVSSAAGLLVAAVGLLCGTAAAARSPLTRRLSRPAPGPAAARTRLPAALWLTIFALAGPGAALGALNLAVPALARAAGAPARAGLLLAALAVGTAAASLLAGRHAAAWTPARRLAAAQAALAAALAAAAAVSGRPALLAVVLATAGTALGTLFVTLYLLVDELTPHGARTRAFGWLVAANNGGMAAGAAVAGELIPGHGGATGLWFAAACALAGIPLAVAGSVARSHADVAVSTPKHKA